MYNPNNVWEERETGMKLLLLIILRNFLRNLILEVNNFITEAINT